MQDRENADCRRNVGKTEKMRSRRRKRRGSGLWPGAVAVLAAGMVFAARTEILDLAKNLILLSGHKPDEDIHIIFTGLRPGEKLYEEMLMDEEGMQDTANNLIHIGKPIELDEEKFMQQLEELKEYVVTEPEDIRECVKKIVPTYHPELAGENK